MDGMPGLFHSFVSFYHVFLFSSSFTSLGYLSHIVAQPLPVSSLPRHAIDEEEGHHVRDTDKREIIKEK